MMPAYTLRLPLTACSKHLFEGQQRLDHAVAVEVHQQDVRRILGTGGATHHAQTAYTKRYCLCRRCVASIVGIHLQLRELDNASIHPATSLDSMQQTSFSWITASTMLLQLQSINRMSDAFLSLEVPLIMHK